MGNPLFRQRGTEEVDTCGRGLAFEKGQQVFWTGVTAWLAI